MSQHIKFEIPSNLFYTFKDTVERSGGTILSALPLYDGLFIFDCYWVNQDEYIVFRATWAPIQRRYQKHPRVKRVNRISYSRVFRRRVKQLRSSLSGIMARFRSKVGSPE